MTRGQDVTAADIRRWGPVWSRRVGWFLDHVWWDTRVWGADHVPAEGPVIVASNHIGASGLIFGWLAFLLVFGWLTRHVWQILISLAVMVFYGGVLLGAVPVLDRCGGVSWQGHLCGAVAGVLAAYLLSRPEREARQRKALGQ